VKAAYLILALAAIAPLAAQESPRAEYTDDRRWVLSNGIIQATFAYTAQNTFQFESLKDLRNGETWQAANQLASSPIRFASAEEAVDAYIPLNLISQSVQRIAGGKGLRQTIVFDEQDGAFRISLSLEIYERQPVLRYSTVVQNVSGNSQRIRMADMLSWNFASPESDYRMLRVNQWSVLPPARNFEPRESLVPADGTREYIHSGAGAPECGWLAIRKGNNRGLIAGWEFDGKTEASVRYRPGQRRLQLSAQIERLNRQLEPLEEFQVPAAFVGLFEGDWDEAGHRTQRFVEAVLAKPLPSDAAFPYVVWDSWGYQTEINEAILRRNAEVAAKLGAELFIVDLGWARAIGDWRDDPVKFPNGLRALSDYVHSLGMKFGLHIAPAEVMEDAPVVRANPDWLSTEMYSYFGAKSLCLSHKPAQEWVVREVVRLIDEYNVDWLLQDGEHMVKQCSRRDHSHDPDDSNYSNAVEGLNAVLDAVQKQRPRTAWENCANGGSMMTFNMVKYYVTSITNDASGALASRQAVYGATYPFPTRYTDRYMPEQPTDTYTTRSYMFGGPWIFMNKLADLTPEQQALAASEIRLYKSLRGQVSRSKVYHLTPMPDAGQVDALAAHDAAADRMVVVVTRDQAPSSQFALKLQGLAPQRNYRVWMEEDRAIYAMTGEQLMTTGVNVVFRSARAAEIVYVEPLEP
jgi:alpha-galactosidase